VAGELAHRRFSHQHRAFTASFCLSSHGGKFGERIGLVKDVSETSRRRIRCFPILDKA
jgi:hypothetical protein